MVQSNRTWFFVASVVSIAALIGGWFFGIQPQLGSAANAQIEATSLDDQNAIAQLELARLKAQDEALPQLQTELDELQLSVPDAMDLETFSAEVAGLAAANGVSLTSVSFTQAVPSVPAAAYANAVPSDFAIENLVAITYTLSLLGPRDGLVSYLRALQFGDRLSVFPSFTLAQGPDAANWGMDVTGVVFVLIGPEGPIEGDVESETENSTPNPEPSVTPTPTSTPSPSPTPSG